MSVYITYFSLRIRRIFHNFFATKQNWGKCSIYYQKHWSVNLFQKVPVPQKLNFFELFRTNLREELKLAFFLATYLCNQKQYKEWYQSEEWQEKIKIFSIAFVEIAVKLQKINNEFQGRNTVYLCRLISKNFLSKQTKFFVEFYDILRVSRTTARQVSCDREV